MDNSSPTLYSCRYLRTNWDEFQGCPGTSVWMPMEITNHENPWVGARLILEGNHPGQEPDQQELILLELQGASLNKQILQRPKDNQQELSYDVDIMAK